MQMSLTSHTTVNTSKIVQLAYHRLYNRPASPLSCLCSSSCSSPLLNENKSGVVDSLQWEIKSINWEDTEVLFIKGLARRELLLLACTVGQTPSYPHLWEELAWLALLPCCKQTPPSPPHHKLYTDHRPPLYHTPVSVRKLGVLCTCKFYKPLVRLVPKIIDIAFSSWQTRLSGHFFHFPALGESSAIPPFLLHFPRE